LWPPDLLWLIGSGGFNFKMFGDSLLWLKVELSGSMLRRTMASCRQMGGGKDVFVHGSALERSGIFDLNEGDVVSFELVEDKNGKFCAANLRLKPKA
jgi:cold shock CspA family protein